MDSVIRIDAFNNDINYLCMIDDCIYNKDAVCIAGVKQLSSKCDVIRSTPCHNIVKLGQKEFCSDDFIELSLISSSKGNQKKYVSRDKKFFVKMQFNYQGRRWNDDLVEVIASSLGKQFGFYCLQQFLGIMDSLDCCYSEFFNGKFIPYKKLDPFREVDACELGIGQLQFVIDYIRSKTGVDTSRYFYEMLIIDYLVCNEDRHLNNFGVIQDGCCFNVAPLFDFGLGLFEHDSIYEGKGIEEAKRLVSAKPFGRQVPLIEWLENKYGFKRPSVASLDGFIFPNKLGEICLKQALGKLGIKVEEGYRV